MCLVNFTTAVSRGQRGPWTKMFKSKVCVFLMAKKIFYPLRDSDNLQKKPIAVYPYTA
jgi:hypothetical protein